MLSKKDVEAVIRHPERIRVYYQPVMNLTSGQPWGYEALARGEGILAKPGRLFKSAEAWGLLGELDAACFKAVLAGGLPPGGFLAVNVTATGLINLEAGVYAKSSLIIELTEYGQLDPRELAGVLERWRRDGARIAIDDVGPDIGQLKAALYLKPDFIKLDRSLVAGCDRYSSKRLFLAQALEVCRYLGAEAIAEGIEKPGELKVLRDLGIEYAQGYLLGRPQPGWKKAVMAGGG
ncbi:EAL domain-containing protein [Neomoorella thermoacetica]|uniref:EAL domain-containing protein n=1 Tax=Neomoorella thermoacetica TaxID=1525 RepID=UPI000916AEF6|nr:EAL domain-containing protein [Moorella thermoacetica]OIQ53436.1 putative membrane protein YjcC [Moorella thermoacetica]